MIDSSTNGCAGVGASASACDNDAALVYDNGEFYTAFFDDADENTGVYLIDNRNGYKKIKLNENADILKEFM